MTEIEVNGIVCAKSTEDEDSPGKIKYWILLSRGTSRIYNPPADQQTMRYNDINGLDPWRFHRVTELCYKYYLRFLEENSEAWYRRAEREVMNAPQNTPTRISHNDPERVGQSVYPRTSRRPNH